MNNKFKGYRWVSHISMANDTNIDTIGTYAYEDEDGAPESLEDAMNAAEDIVLVDLVSIRVASYGKRPKKSKTK